MDDHEILESTEFSWNELQRLINLIPETDPTTYAYGTLLESIERYGAIMKFVDWFLRVKRRIPAPEPEDQPDNIIPFNPPVAEEEKFEEQTEATPSPVATDGEEYDSAVVKRALQDARMQGKISSAKEWIRDTFGLDGFTAIPAKLYPEVMAKLKEIV